jgi:hypothetical protein
MANESVTLKSGITLTWGGATVDLTLGGGAPNDPTPQQTLDQLEQRELLHELALGKPSTRPAAPPGPVFSRGRAIAAASTRMKLEQLHQAKEQAKKDYEHLLAFIDRQIAAKTPTDQLALPSGSGEG